MVGPVGGEAIWKLEVPIPRARASPLGEELAPRRELLDPVVAGVGDVDVAGRIGGDPLRAGELPVAGARLAPDVSQAPGRIEDLDPIVGRVGDVDAAVVDGDAEGDIELPVSGARKALLAAGGAGLEPRLSVLDPPAPREQELSRGAVLDDPSVLLIGDIDVAGVIDGVEGREVKLAVTGAVAPSIVGASDPSRGGRRREQDCGDGRRPHDGQP